MTMTALKSADELKQYILAFLKANNANIVKNKLGYFRIQAQPAPSVKPENSFLSISLHASSDEISRNVNSDVTDSERHDEVHISNDELLKFKSQWKQTTVRSEFMNHPDLATYIMSSFVLLANK